MSPHQRIVPAALAAASVAAAAFALQASPAAAAGGEIRITEWLYQGSPGEFVELTNIGDAPVDLTGWSYDDDSAVPGEFDLSPFGTVQPGESVVFTETSPESFRTAWSLGADVDVIGPFTNNLGRNDQINIFDAADALVDRLTYGDETVGSIRTQGVSGYPSAADVIGANDATRWSRSIVDDAEGSWTNSSGVVGSPGTTQYGSTTPPPDSDEQTVTVVVPEVTEPGEFVWSIDGDPNVQMSEATNAGAYLHSTGELTPISVTDTREGGPEWAISGQVSDFTGGLSGKHLGWTPEVLADGAGAAAGDPVGSGIDGGNGLMDASTLASATAGHELGTGTVGAALDLRLPVDTPAGEYSATLTLTALS